MAQSGVIHIKHMLNKKELGNIAVPTLFHGATEFLQTVRVAFGNQQQPPISARGSGRLNEVVSLCLILASMWNE